MKLKIFLYTIILSFIFCNVFIVEAVQSATRVRSYYRSNGVYVKSYYRSNYNGTKLDNYSTKGNFNPYTGKKGYVNPYKIYKSY